MRTKTFKEEELKLTKSFYYFSSWKFVTIVSSLMCYLLISQISFADEGKLDTKFTKAEIEQLIGAPRSDQRQEAANSILNGVDCTAEVVAHERFHQWVVLEAWAPGGRWYTLYGGPRTTGPFGNDKDGDWLPNFYEEMVSETLPDNPDTFRLHSILGDDDLRYYGDWEYVCMIEGNGKLGDHSRDWSAGIYSKQWP